MPKFTSPLDEVRIAAPCPADWGKMVGDERVRFCGSCDRHVYNLSGMTRREAEALVTNAEGRLCVRFYRRADGTILTRNCPVGLSAVRRRAARVAGSVLSAALGFFAGLGLHLGADRALSPSVMDASAVPAPPMPPAEFAVPAEAGVEVFMGDTMTPVNGEMFLGQGVVMGGILEQGYGYEGEAEAPRVRGKSRRRR
ncbi:MAG: hypothetical protein LC795_17765 [Acidobacteria bacterium]|nr:hypothetical protein [Acidobacteriota bacterium]